MDELDQVSIYNSTITRVMECLSHVVDPELGVDVINLGLIYDVQINDRTCDIEMTLTNMGCPCANELVANVKRVVGTLYELDNVTVNLVSTPVWTRERMTRIARISLGV